MKITLAPVKKFVTDHKVAIAVTATLVMAGGIHIVAVKSWNEFLDSEGLTQKYYNPDAD